jgi:hypothetical protein
MWARVVTIIGGLWLMFAPAVLGYGDPAAGNDRIVGPTIAGAAFVALWPVVRPVRWLAYPAGGWLLMAPWILDYQVTAATVSSVIVGLVTVVATPFGRADPNRFGGGWSSLRDGVTAVD